jgi:hypothetical protein
LLEHDDAKSAARVAEEEEEEEGSEDGGDGAGGASGGDGAGRVLQDKVAPEATFSCKWGFRVSLRG